MPLIKGTSKKSFVRNLKTEMEHGHPQKQSLAIAYSMKRKAEAAKRRHMDNGGEVTTIDPDKAQQVEDSFKGALGFAKGGKTGSRSANHAYNFDHEQGMKGVNKVLPHYDRETGKLGYGGSESHWGGKSSLETQKKHHKQTLSELREMPNPKLKGLAKGGMMQHDSCPNCGYAHGGLTGQGNGKEDPEFEHEEMASGYLSHPGNDVKHNKMAMEEDDKDLNQHGAKDHGPVPCEYEDEDDVVDRIMKKRSPTYESEARLSEGGQVANEEHPLEGDFDSLDDLVLDGDEDFHYTGANSGDEIGDEREDHDREDIVSRIMRSRKKKDRMPSPA